MSESPSYFAEFTLRDGRQHKIDARGDEAILLYKEVKRHFEANRNADRI